MPFTPKGDKIMGAMKDTYGAKKGESVFHASKNKGTIRGVEGRERGKTSRKKASRGARATARRH